MKKTEYRWPIITKLYTAYHPVLIPWNKHYYYFPDSWSTLSWMVLIQKLWSLCSISSVTQTENSPRIWTKQWLVCEACSIVEPRHQSHGTWSRDHRVYLLTLFNTLNSLCVCNNLFSHSSMQRQFPCYSFKVYTWHISSVLISMRSRAHSSGERQLIKDSSGDDSHCFSKLLRYNHQDFANIFPTECQFGCVIPLVVALSLWFVFFLSCGREFLFFMCYFMVICSWILCHFTLLFL